MTNALKAQIIVFANTALTLVAAFGVSLSDAQTAAITAALNAVLGLWVGLTYKASPKRVADA